MKRYEFTVKETGNVNNRTEEVIVYELEKLADKGIIPEHNDVEDFTVDKYESLDLIKSNQQGDNKVADVKVEWKDGFAKVIVEW